MGSHKSQLIDLAKPKYYPGKWKFSQITRCNEWNTIIISLHTRETICDRKFDLVGGVVKNPRIPPPHPGLEFLMEDLETLAIATPEFSGVKTTDVSTEDIVSFGFVCTCHSCVTTCSRA